LLTGDSIDFVSQFVNLLASNVAGFASQAKEFTCIGSGYQAECQCQCHHSEGITIPVPKMKPFFTGD